MEPVDEDTFNMTVRKFLKQVGVTSQREIEKSVRDAIGAGALRSGERLDAKMTLEIDGIGLVHVINGQIEV